MINKNTIKYPKSMRGFFSNFYSARARTSLCLRLKSLYLLLLYLRSVLKINFFLN